MYTGIAATPRRHGFGVWWLTRYKLLQILNRLVYIHAYELICHISGTTFSYNTVSFHHSYHNVLSIFLDPNPVVNWGRGYPLATPQPRNQLDPCLFSTLVFWLKPSATYPDPPSESLPPKTDGTRIDTELWNVYAKNTLQEIVPTGCNWKLRQYCA